jgi:hypothetical protein
MNRFRPLEHWDCGFKSHSRHGCLLAFILCVGSGLATGWFPVQGVLLTVYGLRNWKSGQDTQGVENRKWPWNKSRYSPSENFCKGRVTALTRAVYLYNVGRKLLDLLRSTGCYSLEEPGRHLAVTEITAPTRRPVLSEEDPTLWTARLNIPQMMDWCYEPAFLYIHHSSILAELYERRMYHNSLQITEQSIGITEAIILQTRASQAAILAAFNARFHVS